MNRYAKIKADSSNRKSRDPQSFSTTTTQKSNQYHDTTHHSKSPETQEFNQVNNKKISRNNSDFDDDHCKDINDDQDDSKFGNGFGEKLTRSTSVSSNVAYQQRFRLDRPGSRRVKKPFSMRRSSSVSERYCRIHDQCVTLPSPTFDDGDVDNQNGGYAGEASSTSAEKINNTEKVTSGKFLRVCKRFLRLH